MRRRGTRGRRGIGEMVSGLTLGERGEKGNVRTLTQSV